MSREILFKAKRKGWMDLPREEWWVKGFPFKQWLDGDEVWCIGTSSLAANDFSEIVGRSKLWYEIDPETLCQYIGIEKYAEKDIVKRTDLHKVREPSIGIIEYDVENTAFVIHWIDNPAYSPIYPWKDRIKVIGNIFDNPELLKED